MLRRGQEVKPHARSGGIIAAVEKTNDGFKRVSQRVAPGVADEPRGCSYVVHAVRLRRQLVCYAAAAEACAGANVDLGSLLGRETAQHQPRHQPLQEHQSDAL